MHPPASTKSANHSAGVGTLARRGRRIGLGFILVMGINADRNQCHSVHGRMGAASNASPAARPLYAWASGVRTSSARGYPSTLIGTASACTAGVHTT